jgi:hypothetical protein
MKLSGTDKLQADDLRTFFDHCFPSWLVHHSTPVQKVKLIIACVPLVTLSASTQPSSLGRKPVDRGIIIVVSRIVPVSWLRVWKPWRPGRMNNNLRVHLRWCILLLWSSTMCSFILPRMVPRRAFWSAKLQELVPEEINNLLDEYVAKHPPTEGKRIVFTLVMTVQKI